MAPGIVTPLPPDSQFAHFRITRLIGAGGMGVVYEAVDNLDRTIALKLIQTGSSSESQFHKQLAGEARLAARIDSPYVVRIWEQGVWQGQPYISMEYVRGDDLMVATSGYSLNQLLDLCCQIASGVQAAHDAGLIHRDLKPDNIKITSSGMVKIFDFGLARRIQSDQEHDASTVEGTLHYLSPEHLIGTTLSHSADLFSLGIVIYQLFTRTLPFESDYAAGIVYSILHEDPIPPVEVRPHLPKWIDPLIMTLLAKEPENRFERASSIVDFITASRSGRQAAEESSYTRPKRRVTVFDLRNLSGDSSWDYVCSGFSEDATREIARLTDLVVSAEPGTEIIRNITEAFEQYRCDFVVSGSLMKWQDQIRLQISVMGQLGERVVFGQTYERPSSDLFSLLNRASRDIAQALADATGTVSRRETDRRPVDAIAYDFYLKGRSYYQRNTAEDLVFAGRLFQQALDAQPDYAAAHAGLADVSTSQYMTYYDRSAERIAAAKVSAERAIELDATLPEAHRALGRYYMFSGDPANAERSFLTAIETDPTFAIGYLTIGWLKRGQGLYDEATDWAQRALRHAPNDLDILLLLGLINIDQRRFTPAVATLHRAIELGPDNGRAYYYLGIAYMKQGNLEQARVHFKSSIRYQRDPNCFIDAGYVNMLLGDLDTARRMFHESIDQNHLPFVAEYLLGFLESRAGNKPAAESLYLKSLARVEELLSTTGFDPQVEAYRVLILASLKRPEANEAAAQLRAIAGDNGEVLQNLARAYSLLGDVDAARELAIKGMKAHAGPTRPEIEQDPHFPPDFLAG